MHRFRGLEALIGWRLSYLNTEPKSPSSLNFCRLTRHPRGEYCFHVPNRRYLVQHFIVTSVVWHLLLPLMNSFNKTEAVFLIRICFLGTFHFLNSSFYAFEKVTSAVNCLTADIHLRKLSTPPNTLLNSSLIRKSMIIKLLCCAFSLKLVIERFLEVSNFISLISDFQESLTILTLRFSVLYTDNISKGEVYQLIMCALRKKIILQIAPKCFNDYKIQLIYCK